MASERHYGGQALLWWQDAFMLLTTLGLPGCCLLTILQGAMTFLLLHGASWAQLQV